MPESLGPNLPSYFVVDLQDEMYGGDAHICFYLFGSVCLSACSMRLHMSEGVSR